ncbi:hypothetical protein WMF29_22125 [Sorangium sp. So ce381]
MARATLALERGERVDDRGLLAGDHGRDRAVVAGDTEAPRARGAEALGLLGVQLHEGHRAAAVQSLLEPAPVVGDAQRVLEIERACHVRRGDLPAAVADHRRGLDAP